MTAITESEVRALLAECSVDPLQNIKGTYSITPSEVKALCESWLQLRSAALDVMSWCYAQPFDHEAIECFAEMETAISGKDETP